MDGQTLCYGLLHFFPCNLSIHFLTLCLFVHLHFMYSVICSSDGQILRWPLCYMDIIIDLLSHLPWKRSQNFVMCYVVSTINKLEMTLYSEQQHIFIILSICYYYIILSFTSEDRLFQTCHCMRTTMSLTHSLIHLKTWWHCFVGSKY